MKMELRWLASISASGMHAAAAMLRDWPLADQPLADALSEPVELLSATFKKFHLPPKGTMRHLVPLSASIESNEELADRVVTKMLGSTERYRPAVVELTGAISQLETAFRAAVPDLIDNLELRSRPLREQWDARGPGLLLAMGNKTDRNLMVERADIVLVHPICGGGGEAHLYYNSVRIEAVLANSDPALTETLRLGWMLAMLNLDVPVYSEALKKNRLNYIGALAMLPPALAAGEELEICRCDEETLLRAVQLWRLPVGDETRVVDNVWRWWQTYQAKRPRMGVALAALDRMID